MNQATALVVYVSLLSAAPLSAQEAIPVLKMYDVRDLVETKPAKIAVSPEKEKKARKSSVIGLPARKTDTSDFGLKGLAKFLTTFIEPKLTKHESIACHKGTLLVKATPDKHTWLSNAIAVNRERAGVVITLKPEFLRMNAGVYQNHVLPLLRDRKHAILSRAQRVKFVRVVTAIKGVSAERAPRLMARPMTVSRLTVARQMTYTKDYEVEIQTAKAVATPVIGIVRDGISLDCAVGLLAKGAVAVNMSLVTVELMRPIPTFKTEIVPGTAPVTIQLPQTVTVREQFAFELRSGEAALVAVPIANRNYLVAIIEASVTPPKKK